MVEFRVAELIVASRSTRPTRCRNFALEPARGRRPLSNRPDGQCQTPGEGAMNGNQPTPERIMQLATGGWAAGILGAAASL